MNKNTKKLNTTGVPRADADRIASSIVDAALERSQPKKGWDTSKGRKWVVVAFWGEETTVEFHRDDQEAEEAYEKAVGAGADTFFAKTIRMRKNRDA